MIPYAALVAMVNHMGRKTIKISRDLMEMAELGMICPEYRKIINKIKERVDVEKLPSNHILKHFVRKKKNTREMVSEYDELHTVNTGRGELVYLGMKLVPPRNARSDIVESAHQGNFSPETIYNDLYKYHIWPEMFMFVEAKAKTCDKYKTHEKSKTRKQPFVPIKFQDFEPGECWWMDIMSIGKLDYLVCVDRVSQYMMLPKVGIKTAKACTKALKTWTTFFGIPTLMRSNGGQSSDCKLLDKFCQELGVVHVLTSTYHSPSNGQCKRMGQEVKKMMIKSRERDPKFIMKVLNNT